MCNLESHGMKVTPNDAKYKNLNAAYEFISNFMSKVKLWDSTKVGCMFVR